MKSQVLTYRDFHWLLISQPGEAEMEFLRENYPFHPLNLEDYLKKTQSPKIDIYRHYTLIVLDIPYFDPKEERIMVSEVDFFLGSNYVVCLHDGNSSVLEEVFGRCKKNTKTLKNFLGKGPAFCFYRLANLLIDSFFPVLDKLSVKTEEIDREIWEKPQKGMVAEISLLRRNIVVLQTMAKPTLPIFDRLAKGEFEHLNSEMTNYWNNLLDHLQKIWEKLEDSRELIEGISTSNESVLTYRTNEIVKFLTIITAIAFPFIIVNNLYSMNIIGLPYAQAPFIVPALFGVIFLGGAAILIYFKFRGWL